MKFSILFILFFITSCSTVRYFSSSNGNVEISSPRSTDKIPIEYDRSFYFLLWGSQPRDGLDFDFDGDIFKNNNYSVGNLTITQYQSTFDKFLTLLSLGLYQPYHFNVKGWGEVDEKNNH